MSVCWQACVCWQKMRRSARSPVQSWSSVCCGGVSSVSPTSVLPWLQPAIEEFKSMSQNVSFSIDFRKQQKFCLFLTVCYLLEPSSCPCKEYFFIIIMRTEVFMDLSYLTEQGAPQTWRHHLNRCPLRRCFLASSQTSQRTIGLSQHVHCKIKNRQDCLVKTMETHTFISIPRKKNEEQQL